MTKELTAQEAKDLAYKYKNNLEVYNIAKNLEDVLDGTRESDIQDARELRKEVSDLEDENCDLEREKDSLEEDNQTLEKEVKNLKDAAQAYINDPSDLNKCTLEELL